MKVNKRLLHSLQVGDEGWASSCGVKGSLSSDDNGHISLLDQQKSLHILTLMGNTSPKPNSISRSEGIEVRTEQIKCDKGGRWGDEGYWKEITDDKPASSPASERD